MLLLLLFLFPSTSSSPLATCHRIMLFFLLGLCLAASLRCLRPRTIQSLLHQSTRSTFSSSSAVNDDEGIANQIARNRELSIKDGSTVTLSEMQRHVYRRDHVLFGEAIRLYGMQHESEYVTLDMRLLILAMFSLQRMKPKKRPKQARLLLDHIEATTTRIDHDAIKLFGLAMQLMDVCCCEQQLERSSSNNNNLSADSACSNTGTIINFSATNTTVPASVFLLALLTGNTFWDGLEGVIVESQQHASWRMKEEENQPLDLVTSLSAVDALVKDLVCGLMVLRSLRSGPAERRNIASECAADRRASISKLGHGPKRYSSLGLCDDDSIATDPTMASNSPHSGTVTLSSPAHSHSLYAEALALIASIASPSSPSEGLNFAQVVGVDLIPSPTDRPNNDESARPRESATAVDVDLRVQALLRGRMPEGDYDLTVAEPGCLGWDSEGEVGGLGLTNGGRSGDGVRGSAGKSSGGEEEAVEQQQQQQQQQQQEEEEEELAVVMKQEAEMEKEEKEMEEKRGPTRKYRIRVSAKWQRLASFLGRTSVSLPSPSSSSSPPSFSSPQASAATITAASLNPSSPSPTNPRSSIYFDSRLLDAVRATCLGPTPFPLSPAWAITPTTCTTGPLSRSLSIGVVACDNDGSREVEGMGDGKSFGSSRRCGHRSGFLRALTGCGDGDFDSVWVQPSEDKKGQGRHEEMEEERDHRKDDEREAKRIDERYENTSDGRDEDAGFVRLGTGQQQRAGVTVLVVGDGDLSFSAALMRLMRLEASEQVAEFEGGGSRGDVVVVDEESERETRQRTECEREARDTGERRSPAPSVVNGMSEAGDCRRLAHGETFASMVVASSLESAESLRGKYAEADAHTRFIEHSHCLPQGLTENLTEQEKIAEMMSATGVAGEAKSSSSFQRGVHGGSVRGKVLYTVDATKMTPESLSSSMPLSSSAAGCGKATGHDSSALNASRGLYEGGDGEHFDAIIFNFPFADVVSSAVKPSIQGVTASVGRAAGPTSASNQLQHQQQQQQEVESAFDSNWVGRGRHQALLQGVFRSARKVLKQIPDASTSPTSGSHSHASLSSPMPSGRVLLTLLLSQAAEWDVEALGRQQGFSLERIVPFEHVVFEALGYSRKRSHKNDGFPLPSSSRGRTDAAAPAAAATTTGEAATPTTTAVPAKGKGIAGRLADRQRLQWQSEAVGAWTFVFIPTL